MVKFSLSNLTHMWSCELRNTDAETMCSSFNLSCDLQSRACLKVFAALSERMRFHFEILNFFPAFFAFCPHVSDQKRGGDCVWTELTTRRYSCALGNPIACCLK